MTTAQAVLAIHDIFKNEWLNQFCLFEGECFSASTFMCGHFRHSHSGVSDISCENLPSAPS